MKVALSLVLLLQRDEESETSEEWDDDMNDFEASDEDDYRSTHRADHSRDSRRPRSRNQGAEVARSVR